MNRRFLAMAVVALLGSLPAPVLAQASPGPRAGISQVNTARATKWELSFPRDSVPPNQWKKGVIIGATIGVILGGAGYLFSNAISDTHVSPVIILWPVGILGLLGGMIGSSSRKP